MSYKGSLSITQRVVSSVTMSLAWSSLQILLLSLSVGVLTAQPSFSGTGDDVDNTSVELENPAVTNFREYLRIKSVHPNPDYDNCIQWLRKQAVNIGLEFNHIQFKKPDLFAVWMTWRGSNPDLKSILLNSHMDVVPANAANWKHDPFAAFKDENGDIYGRGALDMKSATVAQLEAIRSLKLSGFVPLRSVHVSILPDEEIGGLHGMRPFVNSMHFQRLNVGFDWDEGSGVYNDVQFNATGISGHGSLMDSGTAGEKIQIVISKMMKFRKEQKNLMETPPNRGPADITSVNLVRMGGGVANNVLPEVLWVVFDIRIRIKPNWNFTDMEQLLDKIADKAGPGVTYHFIQKSLDYIETPMDIHNPWWMNMKATFDKMNWKYQPNFLIQTTDARYARSAGIPALGFNPGVCLRGGGIHDDNEFINERSFLDMIERYAIVLGNLTLIPESVTP